VVQLQPHLAEFENRDASLYVIGSGLPQYIEGFRETTAFTGPVFTDPSLKVFAKAQMVRSVLASLRPRSITNGFKNQKKGLRQGKTHGDAWQQGGALVVGRGGHLLYQHQSTAGGDNVSAQELLSALELQEMAQPGSQ
jgi:hypothetical protein